MRSLTSINSSHENGKNSTQILNERGKELIKTTKKSTIKKARCIDYFTPKNGGAENKITSVDKDLEKLEPRLLRHHYRK